MLFFYLAEYNIYNFLYDQTLKRKDNKLDAQVYMTSYVSTGNLILFSSVPYGLTWK